MTQTFLTVVGIDLATKQLAYMFLPSWVVFNTEVSKVGIDRVGHVMLTVLLCLFFWEIGQRRDIPNIGAYAATAVGGAFANLLSYVFGPVGVLDFIPLGPYAIANFADFAIWVGTIGVVVVVARRLLVEGPAGV